MLPDNVIHYPVHPNLILETLKELAKEQGYGFESAPSKLFPHNEWNEVHCTLATHDFNASFMLQQMPGCCAVLTLSYMDTSPFTQVNIDTLISTVEDAATKAGFGLVTMTQVVPAYSQMLWRREPWFRCLSRGWKCTRAFRNAKSGNLVTLLSKDMEQSEKCRS